MIQDPKLPDVMPRNQPRSGSAVESLMLGAIVLAAVVAVVLYSASDTNMTASNPTVSTTGQGSPRTMAPSPASTPATPEPTAPQATPKQNPDAERLPPLPQPQ
jgi:hypothetical protein